jgi:hypothetical protein
MNFKLCTNALTPFAEDSGRPCDGIPRVEVRPIGQEIAQHLDSLVSMDVGEVADVNAILSALLWMSAQAPCNWVLKEDMFTSFSMSEPREPELDFPPKASHTSSVSGKYPY